MIDERRDVEQAELRRQFMHDNAWANCPDERAHRVKRSRWERPSMDPSTQADPRTQTAEDRRRTYWKQKTRQP